MRNDHGDAAGEGCIEQLDIYRSYLGSPWLSLKHLSYFHAYTRLLERFRHRPITFVEIGVLNGGSLFMWRSYLGPQARIIGIDFNPQARRWESDGFEIHIGDQASEDFWSGFFAAVGPVDVVLDDGGHTYLQQIITAAACIPHIRDGGLLIVEDTHTSYMSGYGPAGYSFMQWVAAAMDQVNARFPGLAISAKPSLRDSIFSVAVFESIVSLEIDRRRAIRNRPVSNGAPGVDAEDFRHFGTAQGRIERGLRKAGERWPRLRDAPLLRTAKRSVVAAAAWLAGFSQARKLRRFF